MKHMIVVASMLLGSYSPCHAAADILLTCVDSEGRVALTNRQCPKGFVVEGSTPEAKRKVIAFNPSDWHGGRLASPPPFPAEEERLAMEEAAELAEALQDPTRRIFVLSTSGGGDDWYASDSSSPSSEGYYPMPSAARRLVESTERTEYDTRKYQAAMVKEQRRIADALEKQNRMQRVPTKTVTRPTVPPPQTKKLTKF